MSELTSRDIIIQCDELKGNWSIRNDQFRKWYDILLLTNDLAQENMESVISNDPGTAFRMARYLLTSSVVSHKIPTDMLERPEITDTSELELYITKHWARLNNEHRRNGKQSWLRELTGLMLATGWYSVFVLATPDKLIAEIWNPMEVFPEFSSEGLLRCAHVYSLTPLAANRKARLNGWTLDRPFTSDTTLYNYFVVDNDGDVANAIVLGDKLVRPITKLSANEQVSNAIPVFVSPVSGLPDMGIIKSGKEWQRSYGESIIAVNAAEYLNQNKMLSYCQQLVRDSANPRWFEQSRSDKGILSPETIFKRGAIFRGGPEDNVTPLPTVPIPVEIRTILFDYANRIQRGLFPWAMFGNVQETTSGYMMSQIAAAAMNSIEPYAEAMTGLLSDVDNYWFREIKERHLKPYGFKMPKNIPGEVEFVVEYNINIPGSLVQRATIARMLDPTFRLDFATTSDLLFPEIKDPLRVQGRVNKDDALMNQIAQIIALIAVYKGMAREAKDAGDADTSALYSKAANAVEAQLGGTQPSTPALPRAKEVRQAVPREETMAPSAAPEGM
jgi:hypothetical protein